MRNQIPCVRKKFGNFLQNKNATITLFYVCREGEIHQEAASVWQMEEQSATSSATIVTNLISASQCMADRKTKRYKLCNYSFVTIYFKGIPCGRWKNKVTQALQLLLLVYLPNKCQPVYGRWKNKVPQALQLLSLVSPLNKCQLVYGNYCLLKVAVALVLQYLPIQGCSQCVHWLRTLV